MLGRQKPGLLCLFPLQLTDQGLCGEPVAWGWSGCCTGCLRDHSVSQSPTGGQGSLQMRFELSEASRSQLTGHKTPHLCPSNTHRIREWGDSKAGVGRQTPASGSCGGKSPRWVSGSSQGMRGGDAYLPNRTVHQSSPQPGSTLQSAPPHFWGCLLFNLHFWALYSLPLPGLTGAVGSLPGPENIRSHLKEDETS